MSVKQSFKKMVSIWWWYVQEYVACLYWMMIRSMLQ